MNTKMSILVLSSLFIWAAQAAQNGDSSVGASVSLPAVSLASKITNGIKYAWNHVNSEVREIRDKKFTKDYLKQYCRDSDVPNTPEYYPQSKSEKSTGVFNSLYSFVFGNQEEEKTEKTCWSRAHDTWAHLAPETKKKIKDRSWLTAKLLAGYGLYSLAPHALGFGVAIAEKHPVESATILGLGALAHRVTPTIQKTAKIGESTKLLTVEEAIALTRQAQADASWWRGETAADVFVQQLERGKASDDEKAALAKQKKRAHLIDIAKKAGTVGLAGYALCKLVPQGLSLMNKNPKTTTLFAGAAALTFWPSSWWPFAKKTAEKNS